MLPFATAIYAFNATCVSDVAKDTLENATFRVRAF